MFVSKKNFGEAFHAFPINSAFNNNYGSILDIFIFGCFRVKWFDKISFMGTS